MSKTNKIIFTVKFLAAISLIFAGAVHTFPYLWKKWDDLVMRSPTMHNYIGAIAFLLGIANLIILFYNKKNKKILSF